MWVRKVKFTQKQLLSCVYVIDLLYDFARRKNYIHINYFEFDDNIGEQLEPDSRRAFEAELFDEGELENMEFIFEYYKDTGTPDLIERSHREKVWLENEKKNGLIEYDYAFDLELDWMVRISLKATQTAGYSFL